MSYVLMRPITQRFTMRHYFPPTLPASSPRTFLRIGTRIATQACLAAVVILLSVSCRSTQAPYQFTPSPLEIQVNQTEGEANVARVLVGIPGAVREGGRQNGRPELVVRMRIENDSAEAIHFDATRSTLLGSDLAEFGAARPQSEGTTTVAAGEAKTVLVHYPFPQDGSLEAPLLTGVNLSLELDIDGGPNGRESVELSASLSRVDNQGQANGRNSVRWGLGYRGGFGYGLGRSYGYRNRRSSGFGFGTGFGYGYGNSYYGGSGYGCW